MIRKNPSFMEVFSHPFDSKFTLLQNPNFRRDYSTRKTRGAAVEVPVEELYPSQPFMNGNKILEYVIAINNGDTVSPAEGVKLGDRIYILNGHHRIAAYIILGHKTVEMSIVDFANSNAAEQKENELKKENSNNK